MTATRDAILGAVGLKRVECEHPVLGAFFLQEMSTTRKVELVQARERRNDHVYQVTHMLAYCVIDEDGAPIFDDAEHARAWLDDVSTDISTPIMDAVAELNGADLEEARRNFIQAENGALHTG